MERRDHLHPTGPWLPLLDDSSRLVQSVCAGPDNGPGRIPLGVAQQAEPPRGARGWPLRLLNTIIFQGKMRLGMGGSSKSKIMLDSARKINDITGYMCIAREHD